MALTEVQDIIGKPESISLEYKSTLPPPSLVARIVSAFANSVGGWLVIGVRESESGIEVVGLPDNVPAPNIVESALSRLRPRPEVNHDFVFKENKRLYVVEVKKATNPPVTVENEKVFMRRGQMTQLVEPQVTELIVDRQLPTCLEQVNLQIDQEGVNVTESMLVLLGQFRNLALVASQSIKSICPASSDKPSRYPHGRTLLRLLFSALADTFERYLSDLLIEIHLAEPSTLKSRSTITAEEILDCQDMTEVIRFIADKRVGALSKGNSKEFGEYLKKVTNLDLFQSSEEQKADEIFARRNLFTHSNGIVDSKFLSVSKTSGLTPGDEFVISLEDLCDTFRYFLTVVSRIDGQVAEKYFLSTSDLR